MRAWIAASLISATSWLLPSATAAQPCPISEGALLGAWKAHTNAGFFDQMSFDTDGKKKVFNSWLHQRPEISGGSWVLRHCVLSVAHPTESAIAFEFAVLKASKNRLHLREVGEAETQVYQRIP